MTISKLTEGVYRCGSDRVNWYLIEDENALTVIETGDPAEVIVAYVEETDLDHVVMGGQGGDTDGLVSHLLGMVPTTVVNEAPVTATVVW
jgi:nucleotide-binding universal stress UspA family protein